MTIDGAIKILGELEDIIAPPQGYQTIAALRLGIEALEQVMECRRCSSCEKVSYLRGERKK
jgi:hypothetical protein